MVFSFLLKDELNVDETNDENIGYYGSDYSAGVDE